MKLLRFAGLVLGLLAQAAAQQTGQQNPQPTGAITGTVVDAVTGQPLAGAVVSLGRATPGPSAGLPRMVTDARGRFIWINLPPQQDYYLGARRAGYEYTRYGWTAPGQSLALDDIARIAVAPNQLVEGIKIPLWRQPSITGRVLDERGEPLVGVAVRVFSTSIVSGNRQLVAGPIVTTDDRGLYRMVALAPGRYMAAVLSVQSTVLATTPEVASVRAVGELQTGGIGAGGPASISGPGIDVDGKHRLALTNFATPPPPSATQPRSYAMQFYPGVATATEANYIELGYGQSRQGIDFQLRPVPAVRVSGRAEGIPAPGVLLRLIPAGSEQLGFGAEAATTVLESDGTFTFLNVPAGSYTLLAQASVMDFTSGNESIRLPDAPGFPGGGISVGSMTAAPGLGYLARRGAGAPSWSRASVQVGSRNIDDVALHFRPVGKVRGRIAFAAGMTTEVPSTSRIRVGLEPANGDPSLGQLSGTAEFKNGQFEFDITGLLGGAYVVSNVCCPPAGPSGFLGFQVVSVTAGGRDLTYAGFDGSAAQEFDDVVVTVTNQRVEISGVVTGLQDKPIAGVIAFPVDRSRWTNFGWSPGNFRTTRAGLNGAYRLRDFAAGEYFLIAVDAAKLDSWVDPKFLAAAAPFATRVTIGWGEAKVQDIPFRDVVVK